jgi:hypothetical protein
MDVVSHLLLTESQGLPLGLLSAKFRFVDLSYFWSADFRAGFRGFPRRSTRAKFFLFILVCGLLALFAGPSTALLLTPNYYDYWPAGGSILWLQGTKQNLWPETLNGETTGGHYCNSPDPAVVSAMFTNMSSCVWNGYPYLAQALKEGHMQPDARLVVNDGVLKREIPSVISYPDTTNTSQVRAWALSSNMIAGLYSSIVADAWWDAINLPRSSLPIVSQNVHWRVINGTQVWVDSPLPLARSQCIYGVISNFADNSSSTEQAVRVLQIAALLCERTVNPGGSFLSSLPILVILT